MSLSIQERLKDLRVERGLTLGSLRSRPGFPSLRWAVTKRKTSRTSATMPLSGWRSFTV